MYQVTVFFPEGMLIYLELTMEQANGVIDCALKAGIRVKARRHEG